MIIHFIHGNLRQLWTKLWYINNDNRKILSQGYIYFSFFQKFWILNYFKCFVLRGFFDTDLCSNFLHSSSAYTSLLELSARWIISWQLYHNMWAHISTTNIVAVLDVQPHIEYILHFLHICPYVWRQKLEVIHIYHKKYKFFILVA